MSDSAARTARKSAKPPRGPRGRAPTLAFRIRVTDGDVIAIGPGKIALLEAVDETGSITAAAKTLGMSYRRAWLLIDEVNRSLRSPAVDSVKGGAAGGRTSLTDTGRTLVVVYRRVEATAAAACRVDIRKLIGMLAG